MIGDNELQKLANRWMQAKAHEAEATNARRYVEDELTQALALAADMEGAQTVKDGPYTIKVTGRLNRKIDSDRLQELAAEHGLTDHLPNLFRWRPEINMSVWRHAAPNITKPLLGAITTEPGRPSYQITNQPTKDN